MIDITPIVQALVALVGTIVTIVLIPLIKSKTTAAQQEKINLWVSLAVQAAEQIFTGSGLGAQKKMYVIEYLATHGIKLDAEALDVLIEAAVYELKNGVLEQIDA